MTKYYVSISFSDVSADEMNELVQKLIILRHEYSLTIFEDVPEEETNGI